MQPTSVPPGGTQFVRMLRPDGDSYLCLLENVEHYQTKGFVIVDESAISIPPDDGQYDEPAKWHGVYGVPRDDDQ